MMDRHIVVDVENIRKMCKAYGVDFEAIPREFMTEVGFNLDEFIAWLIKQGK